MSKTAEIRALSDECLAERLEDLLDLPRSHTWNRPLSLDTLFRDVVPRVERKRRVQDPARALAEACAIELEAKP